MLQLACKQTSSFPLIMSAHHANISQPHPAHISLLGLRWFRGIHIQNQRPTAANTTVNAHSKCSAVGPTSAAPSLRRRFVVPNHSVQPQLRSKTLHDHTVTCGGGTPQTTHFNPLHSWHDHVSVSPTLFNHHQRSSCIVWHDHAQLNLQKRIHR